MARFRCPECGVETDLIAKYGDEIVSVYCLKHTGAADVHTRPVYMALVAERVMAPIEREPVAA